MTAPTGSGGVVAVGDFVETLFDTGAFGLRTMYGVVIAAGPKCYRVRWESGLTNRLPQGYHDVGRPHDMDEARAVLARCTGAES